MDLLGLASGHIYYFLAEAGGKLTCRLLSLSEHREHGQAHKISRLRAPVDATRHRLSSER